MKKGEDYIGVTVAFLCHDGEGNILLAKRGAGARDENGRWDNGGGSIEFGDSVEDTLAKEIREEYGVEMLEHEFIGYRDVFRELSGRKTHWLSLDFLVRVDREKAKNAEPHKFDDIGWFSPEELPSPMHSHSPAFIAKHKAKLRKRYT